MAIAPLPTPAPNLQTNTPEQFTQNVDALLGALPAFVSGANELQSDINSKQSTATTAASTATAKASEAELSASRSAASAATASTQANNASNSYNATQLLTVSVLEAQAQTNALLGLGIGGSVINENGELIMTYNDDTVTSIAFNANGELILTY
jgi:hypothetical protein